MRMNPEVEIKELNAIIAQLTERAEKAERERDALAALVAHVLDQFDRHDRGEDMESDEDAHAWAERARAALSGKAMESLTKIKAQWQADALDMARYRLPMADRARDTLQAMADEYRLQERLRRQAEAQPEPD